jgi:hypothetical protein
MLLHVPSQEPFPADHVAHVCDTSYRKIGVGCVLVASHTIVDLVLDSDALLCSSVLVICGTCFFVRPHLPKCSVQKTVVLAVALYSRSDTDLAGVSCRGLTGLALLGTANSDRLSQYREALPPFKCILAWMP